MPEGLSELRVSASEKPGLQDIFLSAAHRQSEPMTMFLVNGVMLQGQVAGFDAFVILLERGGQVQLVYKHAVSTLQPATALDLGREPEGEDH
jgi:host factor-I protein